MNTTRRTMLCATGGFLTSSAGCLGRIIGSDEPPDRDVDAETLVERSRAAVSRVSSYRYDLSFLIDQSGDGRGDRFDGTVDGAVDLESNRLWQTATVNGETVESYFIDGTRYSQCTTMGWEAEAIETDGDLIEMTPAARQLSLFESGDLSEGDFESIGGRETTAVVGHPPPDALDREQGDGTPSFLPFGGPNIDRVSVRAWIDRETDLPLRTEIEFDVSQRGERATASMTGRFTDYGEPVTIELPEGAVENRWELGCPER